MADTNYGVQPRAHIHGGIVTAFGLMFAWFILGRLVDLLMELLWMVWIAITVSATCYLPTVWVHKHSNRMKMSKILSRNIALKELSEHELFNDFPSEPDGISVKSSEDNLPDINLDINLCDRNVKTKVNFAPEKDAGLNILKEGKISTDIPKVEEKILKKVSPVLINEPAGFHKNKL